MSKWGIGGVLVMALAVYGCGEANGGQIGGAGGDGGSGGMAGDGGSGGAGGDGGSGGMAGDGGSGGAGGDGGSGGMAGDGGSGGMAGDGGSGGMAGAGGMGGMAGAGGMGGMAGAGGMGGMAGAGGMGGIAGAGGTGGMAGAGGVGGTGGAPPKTSCLEWRDAGATVDNIYVIEVGGGELSVYCDMTTLEGGWTQLYDQDVANGYLPTADAWVGPVNPMQPNGGQYSILNLTAQFKNTSDVFEFLIDWDATRTDFVHWTQSEDPFDGRGLVVTIAQSPNIQVGCSTEFGGLADERHGSSLLDGSPDETCWWWAVGTWYPLLGGIPAYSASAGGGGPLVATRTRLWVR